MLLGLAMIILATRYTYYYNLAHNVNTIKLSVKLLCFNGCLLWRKFCAVPARAWFSLDFSARAHATRQSVKQKYKYRAEQKRKKAFLLLSLKAIT